MYLDPAFEQLIDSVRTADRETDEIALLMAELGLIDEDQLTLADEYQDPVQFLGKVMQLPGMISRRLSVRYNASFSVHLTVDCTFKRIQSFRNQ